MERTEVPELEGSSSRSVELQRKLLVQPTQITTIACR